MIKLVIFDLDGTLLNTIDDLSMASNMALAYYNYPQHSVEECKHMVGNGIYKLVERSLPEYARDEAHVLKVKAIFDSFYAEHSQDMTKPYKEVEVLLEQLTKRHVHTGVVTNKAHDYAGKLMKHYFGEKIECTLGQREGVPAKPHPQGVFEMMAHFKVKPEECLYIGDSNVDIETAKAAGVTSVGVLWGFRGEQELKAAGADHLISHPLELLEIINRSNDKYVSSN